MASNYERRGVPRVDTKRGLLPGATMGKDEGYILQEAPGTFVSKTKLIVAAVAFVVLIIIIIILAAVLGHQNAQKGNGVLVPACQYRIM